MIIRKGARVRNDRFDQPPPEYEQEVMKKYVHFTHKVHFPQGAANEQDLL